MLQNKRLPQEDQQQKLSYSIPSSTEIPELPTVGGKHYIYMVYQYGNFFFAVYMIEMDNFFNQMGKSETVTTLVWGKQTINITGSRQLECLSQSWIVNDTTICWLNDSVCININTV